MHVATSKAKRDASVSMFMSLLVPILLISAGCSRKAETSSPAITATDRALPVPVSIPDESSSPQVRNAVSKAQHKIAVEDTLEPVSIDNASVPSSTHGVASGSTKK